MIVLNCTPSHKGKQCRRGEGLIYSETKRKLNLTITPTGIAKLDAKAKIEGCSISTLIEEFARSNIIEKFYITNATLKTEQANLDPE